MNVHQQRTLRRVLASPLEDSVFVEQKNRRRNKMVPDTSTRANSALEHRPTLLCEAGATHSVRKTFAVWAWVTRRTRILACLAVAAAGVACVSYDPTGPHAPAAFTNPACAHHHDTVFGMASNERDEVLPFRL